MNTKEAIQKMGGSDTFFGGFNFVTPDAGLGETSLGGTAFFGVINGLGLVHVYGDVKVFFPDGHEVQLKEKRD